jgi:hypothetical protein
MTFFASLYRTFRTVHRTFWHRTFYRDRLAEPYTLPFYTFKAVQGLHRSNRTKPCTALIEPK